MSTSESQEPLQERLKDQVSVSIKEALDKANTVLTNLHRVQSYLDVIRILSTHRSSDVIKNALEQIHAARNDTATLLQHIYLTEIGLQSLQVHVYTCACNVDLGIELFLRSIKKSLGIIIITSSIVSYSMIWEIKLSKNRLLGHIYRFIL